VSTVLIRALFWAKELPMKRFLGLSILLLIPYPVLACSLCGTALNQSTLRQEWQQASVVLYGTLANPRFNLNPGAQPGSGVTDLHIVQVLKPHPILGNRKVVQIDRYLPVVDPKNPPKFLVFCTVVKDKLNPVAGRNIASDSVLQYLLEIARQKPKDRVEELLFFFRYLDHNDPAVAADAYFEFAKSSDAEVARVARHVKPDTLRRLLQNDKTPPERLGLFAFLLGSCGGDRDAELLRSLIASPKGNSASQLDGILAGFIQLRPKEGWHLVYSLLADEKRRFEDRYSVIRMVEFQHATTPAQSRKEVLRACEIMLDSGQLADFAVEDLRKWQAWDLTPHVLKQYGKKTHDTPIVRRAIIRYALACPQPEARGFIDSVRRQDPDLVKELQESLEYLTGK
jgi:hypothetical protein